MQSACLRPSDHLPTAFWSWPTVVDAMHYYPHCDLQRNILKGGRAGAAPKHFRNASLSVICTRHVSSALLY